MKYVRYDGIKLKRASKAVSFLVEGGNDTFRSSESR
jgi:hypothetical protein